MTLLRPLAVLAALALTISLAGCAPASGTGLVEAPEGLRVSVYQPRPDVPKNRMAIQVHNDGAESLTITSAELRSSFFTDDTVWGPERTATVKPGYAVDLRVDVPADADCSGVEPELTAVIGWTIGDRSGTSSVTPDDPFHLLDLLHDAACLIVHVDEVAALTATSLEVPSRLPAAAELVITVEPTGADGAVTLDTINSTTLLNPADSAGVGVPELDLGVEIDKDGPAEVRIPVVPNRCDAHALAEDKVGTRMPLYVTAPDGSTGRLVLAADDELRMQMYAFYSSYCGL